MNTGRAGPEPGILIVEDHEISRQHTVQALLSVSSRVWQAASGAEALACAAVKLPDLIFTDIHLPDSCGVNLPASIRATWPPSRPLPLFVILSGDDSYRMAGKTIHPAVEAILIKPVGFDEIRNIAIRLLHLEQEVRESAARPMPHEQLKQLLLQELETRLPKLDRDLSALDWESAAKLTHQLIASSSMCRERKLELHCRRLHQALLSTARSHSIAESYFSFLQAVDQVRTESQAW